MIKSIRRRWRVYKWKRKLEENLKANEALYDSALCEKMTVATANASIKIARYKLNNQLFLRSAREQFEKLFAKQTAKKKTKKAKRR